MTLNGTHILVLNDGSRYENWGIKACIDGLLKSLYDSIPKCQIEGLPHEYMHKRYVWEPKIMGKKLINENSRIARRFLSNYHMLPRIADEFDYVADLWDRGKGGVGAKDFITCAKRNDVIVFNAEGSTYRDNIGAIKGLFMLWYAKTRMQKRCYFMNGSVTLTLVDSTLPAMVHKVFGVVDGVAVREPYSFRSVLNWFPELNLTMIPDSVFGLDIADYVPIKEINLAFLEKPFFCFSLSMLPMDFRLTKDKSSIVAVIKELKNIVPTAVLLAKDDEDQLLKEVAQLTDSYFVGPEFSYLDISYILSKATFLFSGRYHHLIFATKVGCPIIPMASSSHKIHGLAELFDELSPSPIDPTDLWEAKNIILKAASDIIHLQNVRSKYYDRSALLRDTVQRQVKQLMGRQGISSN